MIGRAVTDLPDLKAFTRSHKWIKGALGGQLYKRDPDIALRAGIAKQNLNTVQNAIRAGANLTKRLWDIQHFTGLLVTLGKTEFDCFSKHGADHGMKANSPVTSAMHVMISSPSLRRTEPYVCIAKAFIEYQADINRKHDGDGQKTAFASAAWHGNLGMVNFLLINNADIESEDRCGGNPLHAAVRSCNDTIVKLLLDKGASVDAEVKERRTPLWWAREYGADSIETLLV
ncbi:ankyrin repeats (3 copies) domain-containing protein [Metarhizium brunneum]